ncbi:MAG: hypothetical protein Q9220_001327 [cf. Caloplaca sp. 1 TL-2023]
MEHWSPRNSYSGKADAQEEDVGKPPLLRLPAGLIALICKNTFKNDLKSLRRVCHKLDESARPYLFDTFIIAWDPDVIRAADEFFGHSSLSSYCQTLVFDVQCFKDLTRVQYIEHLVQQLASDFKERDEISPIPWGMVMTLDQFDWFHDPGSTPDREQLVEQFGKHVLQGYAAYQNKRHEQEKMLNHHWSSHLALILRRCSSIHRIEMQTAWRLYGQAEVKHDSLETLLPCYPCSGMVGRHWHSLYLRPALTVFHNFTSCPMVSDLLHAIHESRQRVTHLEFQYGCVISDDSPGRKDYETRWPIAESIFKDLKNINVFSLATNVIPRAHQNELIEDMVLPALKFAQSLETFQFRAGTGVVFQNADPPRRTLLRAFPDYLLPRLTCIRLVDLQVTPTELFGFIARQTLLKSLMLQAIDIPDPSRSDGLRNWMVLFGHFRRHLALTNFSIEAPLRIVDGQSISVICGDTDWTETKYRFEEYVLRKTDRVRLRNGLTAWYFELFPADSDRFGIRNVW